MPTSLKICKNTSCSNVVTPSERPGRPKLYCSRRCANTQAVRDAYKRTQLPVKVKDGEIRICKNDRCTKFVPESKNSGVPRLYCSPICSRNQNSRNAYGRHFGNLRGVEVSFDGEGDPFVRRTPAHTAAVAKKRLDAHELDCALNPYDRRCPSRNDIYAHQRLCQVYAVFAEDWHTLRRKERGNTGDHAFVRTATSIDGYWLEGDEEYTEDEDFTLEPEYVFKSALESF